MIKRQEFVTLPNGPIKLVFRKCESGKSKAGNPQFIFTFTPETGEPILKDYFPYETKNGWNKLEAFLCAIGVELEGDSFDERILDDLLGIEVPAVILNETYQGVLRPKISYYGEPRAVDESTVSAIEPKKPLAPLLSKEEQEEMLQFVKDRVAGKPLDWDAQREAHQQESQDALEDQNNGAGTPRNRTLGDLKRTSV
jgi:hypothetical protein